MPWPIPARQRDAAAADALKVVLAAILGLGVALVVLRSGLFKGIIRFTLRMMSEVAQETFRRVQRFSTDWHANSFAGSTVRKMTRGMWAFDMLNDTVLMALLAVARRAGRRDRSCSAGTGRCWASPSASAPASTSADGEAVARLRRAGGDGSPTPGTRRLGGALADAICCNAVVKAFGAEDAEDARLRRRVAQAGGRARGGPGCAPPHGTIQHAMLLTSAPP